MNEKCWQLLLKLCEAGWAVSISRDQVAENSHWYVRFRPKKMTATSYGFSHIDDDDYSVSLAFIASAEKILSGEPLVK